MPKRISAGCLLMGLMLGMASAQTTPSHAVRSHAFPVDLAVVYNAERGRVVSADCGCFWLQGLGLNANVGLWHGWGIAADMNGGRASNIAPDVSLAKINYFFGPRYMLSLPRWKDARESPSLFGEFLLGGVHAFDTVIPSAGAVKNSANALAFQAGGGATAWFAPHLGVRVIELDYIYSQLPNASSSRQNDFRIATGIVWRIR
jgi:outer membrane immunogenic protein